VDPAELQYIRGDVAMQLVVIVPLLFVLMGQSMEGVEETVFLHFMFSNVF